MFDELDNVNNTENNNEQVNTATPDYHSETVEDAAVEPERSEVPQEESSSFYHYAGEGIPKEEPQRENTFNAEQRQYQNYNNYNNYQNYGYAPEKTVKKQKKAKKPASFGKKLGMTAAIAAVFGIVSGTTFYATEMAGRKLFPTETEKTTIASAETLAEVGKDSETKNVSSTGGTTDIAAVVKNTKPSIVAITNRGVQEVQSLFFGTTQRDTESSGSGVIVAQTDRELLIATNNHVVDGAKSLSVCFTVDVENKEDLIVEAVVKGKDPNHDLAVVAVNLEDISAEVKSKIKVAATGDSDALAEGQQVIAIGNALGYGQSTTVGYVSALDREVTLESTDGTTITNNLIQTDAAINFGNSGGALLNTKGELIGINSAKTAATGVEGMGYAIPINTAKPILEELMNRKTRTKVEDDERGYMGIVPQNVTQEARQIYNMPAGAFVYSVTEGSPAEAAGVHKGDIITEFDGLTIVSATDLLERMSYYKIGEEVEVVVQTQQGGEYVERTVTMTLGERPEDVAAPQTPQQETEEMEEPDSEEYYEEFGDEGQMFPFEEFFGR